MPGMTELREYADRLCDIARRLGNDTLIQTAAFLRQRIYQPDGYVALLGESCCGKSTVLNSMLGQGILPVSPLPSTGAVTEVFLDRETDDPVYAVIRRNATMELLDFARFCQLAVTPDATTARLRATLPAHGLDTAGARLFDTPGYDSLIAEHEEVLEEFLPNCDHVVYLVNYRTGIQQSDYAFLRELMALSRPGIPFCLVINRAPAGAGEEDSRVREIRRNAAALLTVPDLPLFIIPSVQLQDGLISSPELDRLRRHIICELRSPRRQAELHEAFLTYLQDLAAQLRTELERRLRNARMSEENARGVEREIERLRGDFQHAVDEIVKPGIQKIRDRLPDLIRNCRNEMEDAICAEIDKQSVAGKDEMNAYTNSHLLPFYNRKQAENIQHYLTVELDALDKEVNDYLNTAIIRFERDIQLRYSSAVRAGVGAAKGLAGKLLNGGLVRYFMKFGGRGGSGAGMANAASHALKKVGDLFGHTFSRSTHNALKHTMAKMGLTSVKTLGAASAGAVEVGFMAADAATWKPILKGKVKKALGNWETEANQLILADLDKVETENVEALDRVRDMQVAEYAVDAEPVENVAPLQNLMAAVATIEKELDQDE